MRQRQRGFRGVENASTYIDGWSGPLTPLGNGSRCRPSRGGAPPARRYDGTFALPVLHRVASLTRPITSYLFNITGLFGFSAGGIARADYRADTAIPSPPARSRKEPRMRREFLILTAIVTALALSPATSGA